ncbi:hypothetical protein BJ138DRAFT_1105936 [Hygrophoropsis aurantiaca]|uniref:Uncharacterized protein n=1 Tax=Hygrophoropsis aurantiaca TaxID=72124 RepID=A0ACB7ZXX6_9AGAM|nr:hypothetical protein BJ138DRAFT_1105936 [Hygrophoropsis aurantiaca]
MPTTFLRARNQDFKLGIQRTVASMDLPSSILNLPFASTKALQLSFTKNNHVERRSYAGSLQQLYLIAANYFAPRVADWTQGTVTTALHNIKLLTLDSSVPKLCQITPSLWLDCPLNRIKFLENELAAPSVSSADPVTVAAQQTELTTARDQVAAAEPVYKQMAERSFREEDVPHTRKVQADLVISAQKRLDGAKEAAEKESQELKDLKSQAENDQELFAAAKLEPAPVSRLSALLTASHSYRHTASENNIIDLTLTDDDEQSDELNIANIFNMIVLNQKRINLKCLQNVFQQVQNLLQDKNRRDSPMDLSHSILRISLLTLKPQHHLQDRLV